MRNLFFIALLLLLSVYVVAPASGKDLFEIETEGSCQLGAGASVDLAKKVALFTAQRKAVDAAGQYLTRKNLTKAYGPKKEEIYSLAADEIQTDILAENQETTGEISIYRLRIKTRIQASDFIKAEIEDSRQEEEESKESYQEEMEQPVSEDIAPGRDIAKAYRLIRLEKWRIATIYLDHLEIKYPNWDRVYMAKAVTHDMLHEPVFMEKALRQGCKLGNKAACADLKR